MKKIIYSTVKLLRPRQWIKNLALFAAILFGGALFNFDAFQKAALGFIVFCGLSSAIYIINDMFDVEKDRLHPFKRFRPLAKGDLSRKYAFTLVIFLTIVSFILGLFISPTFFLIITIYFLLQLFYSATLKSMAVIDILAIAAGYMLRVYAGEFATGYHISVWLLLTTISISLFLAIGKRRSELTLISGYSESQIKATRKSLSHYSERLLDVYASIFATSTFISYALFTFLESSSASKLSLFMPDFLPSIFQRKWLMVTILPVAYGLMRYLQDIYEKHEGESPEKVLLSDSPLLINVLIWIALIIGIIYFAGGA